MHSDVERWFLDTILQEAGNCHLYEKIGYKIREAQLKKVPYMIVTGANEEATNTVSLRSRDGETTDKMTFEELIAKLSEEVRLKK